MAVANQNFVIYQRSDYILDVTVTDEDSNPLVMTGASFEFAIWKDSSSDILRITGDRIRIVDTGKVEVSIYEEDLDVAPNLYNFELRLMDMFGNTAPVTLGKVLIRKSNTNK